MKVITREVLISYKDFLLSEEKSGATVSKYLRDVFKFADWFGNGEVTKESVLLYKVFILEKYAVASVNSMISSLNSFFAFSGWNDLKVKTVKILKQIFASVEEELTKQEYERLLGAARDTSERLYLLMQCICSTGIRVSELKYITVDALDAECARINNKGKLRVVFLPTKLCKMLTLYVKEHKIKSGPVFVSKNGRPLDRSNIWTSMKKLCTIAGVAASKVFPHNLRHLFARTYYSIQKDIVRLADILGHSSINTPRIYTRENGDIHRQQIQKLGLLQCCPHNLYYVVVDYIK